MTNLTLRNVVYRLYRLRRLVVVSALIPIPPLALAIWMDVAIGWWFAGVWASAVIIHTARFPNAWIDIMALAISVALVLLICPIFGLIGLGPILGYPLAAIFGFILWLSMINRFTRLDAWRFPVQNFRLRRRTRLSPEEMRDAFFLRPDAQVGFHRCHAANENGVFLVSPQGIPAMASVLEEDAVEPDLEFFATVVESDEHRQETVYISQPPEGEPEIHTTVEFLKPRRVGTLYEKREHFEGFTLLSGLGFWLQEYDADHFTATIDHVTGKPPRAIRAAPHDSLLFMIANWFIRRRMAEADEA